MKKKYPDSPRTAGIFCDFPDLNVMFNEFPDEIASVTC